MEISATPAGVDVHAGAIQVSVLAAGAARAEEWRLEHEPRAVRRPARRLKKRGAPGSLVACYEARPTGFARQRRPADARDAPQGRHAAPLRELTVRPAHAFVSYQRGLCTLLLRRARTAGASAAISGRATLAARPPATPSARGSRCPRGSVVRSGGSSATIIDGSTPSAPSRPRGSDTWNAVGSIRLPRRARITPGGPPAASREGWRASAIAGHGCEAGSAGSRRHIGITSPPPPCSSQRGCATGAGSASPRHRRGPPQAAGRTAGVLVGCKRS